MLNILNRIQQLKEKFSDIVVLGLFLDNHDNTRFLHDYPNVTNFLNALTLTLTWTGIPVMYQGTEQNFNGGNDPQNREVLWTNMNTSSDTYNLIKKINKAREINRAQSSEAITKCISDNM